MPKPNQECIFKAVDYYLTKTYNSVYITIDQLVSFTKEEGKGKKN